MQVDDILKNKIFSRIENSHKKENLRKMYHLHVYILIILHIFIHLEFTAYR